MKKLKLKREIAFGIQKTLKEIPPRLVPSTQEIIVTATKTVPAIEKHVGGYLQMLKERDEIVKQLDKKKISKKEFDKKLVDLGIGWDKYRAEHADDEVEVELEDDAFNFLHEQFQRENKELGNNDVWGRSWAPTDRKSVV